MKPSVAIFDVDGTLADTRPLRHLVVGHGKDFDAFHLASADAMPNPNVVDRLNWWRNYGVLTFVLTARDGKWADMTLDWLTRHHIRHDGFCARPAGDNRRDDVVKAEMLDWIGRHHEVVHAYDDRPRVVSMWHANRIPVTIVAGWYGDTDPSLPPPMSTHIPTAPLPPGYRLDQEGEIPDAQH